MRKPRKTYTAPEKVAILRRHLIDRVPVSDLCDEYQLQPTLFYNWQKQFFENGAAALERKNAAPDGRGTGYGFGWQVGTLDGHPTAEHGGRAHGFTGYMISVADAGLFVVVLCNTDDKSAARPERLATRIARSLLDDRTTTVGPLPDLDLRLYTGGYRGTGAERLRFAAGQGELMVEDQNGRRPLVRTGDDTFLSRRDVTRFRFVRDDQRRVRSVLVHPRIGVERRLLRYPDTLDGRGAP